MLVQCIGMTKQYTKTFSTHYQNTQMTDIIDTLKLVNQSCYNYNRELGETPDRLSLIFGESEVSIMEKTFQKELTTKNI